MLLALDAGNTNITVGIFEGGALRDHRRLRTVRDQTSDEWGILLLNLLRYAGIDAGAIDGIIISSVVPPLNSLWRKWRIATSGPKRCSLRLKRIPASRFVTRIPR